MFDGGKALLRVLQTQEGTGVALGQAVVVQSLRHRLLQPQQAQLVGHGGLAAAQPFRRLLLAEAVAAEQAGDGGRLLQVNRNSLDKSFYQEDSHRKSEGNIRQKQGKPLV